MLMSIQELLLCPGIAFLVKQSNSRLDRFGMHVLGIHSDDLSAEKLKPYAVFSESGIQFLYGTVGYLRCILDISKRYFDSIKYSFYVFYTKEKYNKFLIATMRIFFSRQLKVSVFLAENISNPIVYYFYSIFTIMSAIILIFGSNNT